jgi:hypothetical protein
MRRGCSAGVRPSPGRRSRRTAPPGVHGKAASSNRCLRAPDQVDIPRCRRVATPAAAVEQAESVVFHVPLSGVDPEGAGVAVLRFDPATGELCYELMVRGIGEPTEPQPGLGSAHIHLRATGGIAVHLDADFDQAGQSDVLLARTCVEVDAATLEAILANPSAFYVNIHTVQFPGGAIEGTLG